VAKFASANFIRLTVITVFPSPGATLKQQGYFRARRIQGEKTKKEVSQPGGALSHLPRRGWDQLSKRELAEVLHSVEGSASTH